MIMNGKRTRVLGLIEKSILGLIAGGAAAIGIVDLVFLVQRVISLTSDRNITVSEMPLRDAPTPDFTDGISGVVAASYDTVTMTVEAMPASVRGWMIAATILGSLVSIGICAALVWLCLRVFVGRPFVASATKAVGIAAILVIAGGLGGSLFTGISNAEVANVIGLAGTSLPAFTFVVDLAPLGWGLALAVVAGAFEIGQRLQRETEGLV